jgi:hypothetical protein
MVAEMTFNRSLVERPDEWVLPVAGRSATRCVVDHAFSIHMGEPDESYQLRIESDFFLTGPESRSYLSMERPRELGVALGVLRQSIISARAYKSGKLEVLFTSDIGIVVEPSPDFEAWELVGDDGLRIVCTPGGDLAVWKPSARQ